MKIKEVWKPFPYKGLEDKYEISNLANVKNTETENILATHMAMGYLAVNIKLPNGKRRSIKVHRRVAMAFVKNNEPDKKTWVNHIDGDKMNSKASNLEWVTPSENVIDAYKNGLIKPFKRAVIQYNLKTKNIIEIYDSVLEAHYETGISIGQICDTCKGKWKQACGYGWKYLEENPNQKEDIDLSEFKQIVDFPNYLINDNGDIYSLSHKRFLKYQENPDKSQVVQLTNKGKRKDFLVQRLVAAYFLKRTDDDYDTVKHKDGDKTNNNVKNLKWIHCGCEAPDIYFDQPFYNPNTAIKSTKRKLKKDGSKDLLTANPHCLSIRQRAERKKLLEKKNKSGSKSAKAGLAKKENKADTKKGKDNKKKKVSKYEEKEIIEI